MKPCFSLSRVRYNRQNEAHVCLGVRSICGYMRIGPSTFYTWTRGYDFPATRTPDGRWMTCTALIENWIKNRLERQKGIA